MPGFGRWAVHGAGADATSGPRREPRPVAQPVPFPVELGGVDRSPRQRFAAWMEATFGLAYLPIAMGVGGIGTGVAAFLLVDKVTHLEPLAAVAGVFSGIAGAIVGAATIFAD